MAKNLSKEQVMAIEEVVTAYNKECIAFFDIGFELVKKGELSEEYNTNLSSAFQKIEDGQNSTILEVNKALEGVESLKALLDKVSNTDTSVKVTETGAVASGAFASKVM